MSDSKITYKIHPAIGFARVGDAPDAYYLEPTEVGGLPTEIVIRRGPDGKHIEEERTVTEFKHAGQVKRQAARFRVYRYEEGKDPVDVSIAEPPRHEEGEGKHHHDHHHPAEGHPARVKSIKWTVHVANKKAAWYNFAELQGDVMLGKDNTYRKQGVPLRNASYGARETQRGGPCCEEQGVAPTPGGDVATQYHREKRQELIIDPGPRTVTHPGDGWVQLDATPVGGYKTHFPPADLTPYPVTTLGQVRMTGRGELLVLGGLGNAGGPPGSSIASFGGADGWFDDVSDGPVVAEVELHDGTTIRLDAWVVAGAPKLAPELVNITSLADTFIDVGVRHMGLCPELYRPYPGGEPGPAQHFGLRYPPPPHDGHERGHSDRLRGTERDRKRYDRERGRHLLRPHIRGSGDGGDRHGHEPHDEDRNQAEHRTHDEHGRPYGWQPDYVACLERDILPIFRAMKEYRWVANVDAMVSVATPPFDLSDLSEANRENRRHVFRTFRRPEKGRQQPELDSSHQKLFGENGFPMMPLNSGDNSITNHLIEKFMAVTPTQYWLLHQWAEGKCVSRKDDPEAGRDWRHWASPLDIATAGNAVGEPMAPGIEVTWTMRNPEVLTPGDPFRIRLDPSDYAKEGLDPFRDETNVHGGEKGCQPGDLTKRMAIPWQADFFDCSEQDVNFTTPRTNKTISAPARIPLAPTFLSYWWPAQSPFNVYSGAHTATEQMLDGGAFLGGSNLGQVMGQNVLYHRGLNSFFDSVVGWKYLGFILNRTTGPQRDMFPFFVERERNYEAFASGYQGLTSDGLLYTTQPTTTTSAYEVNNESQNVFPLQWLIGN
ncbi:MAG TPA: LodA/GoxA family CTQ-dependent oxidase [Longimicrobium sp.]